MQEKEAEVPSVVFPWFYIELPNTKIQNHLNMPRSSYRHFLKKTLQLCKIDGFSDADLGLLQYPRWSSL